MKARRPTRALLHSREPSLQHAATPAAGRPPLQTLTHSRGPANGGLGYTTVIPTGQHDICALKAPGRKTAPKRQARRGRPGWGRRHRAATGPLWTSGWVRPDLPDDARRPPRPPVRLTALGKRPTLGSPEVQAQPETIDAHDRHHQTHRFRQKHKGHLRPLRREGAVVNPLESKRQGGWKCPHCGTAH
jgi:hypothetical protein